MIKNKKEASVARKMRLASGIEIIDDGEDDGAEESESKYVKWFSELSKKDVAVAGGKGANLGEMYRIGMPVPQGFVITAEAYFDFLEETELKDEIYEILSKIDIDDTAELESTARKIREIIENAEMPQKMQEEILENYKTLGVDEDALEKAYGDALAILKRSFEPVFVAVRSSATAEDTKTASFAGQNETFLNIKGNTSLIEAVKKCWASLFTARSIYYRVKRGFKHEDVLIAVIVQIMVNSDKSGVIFSRDPVMQNENIVIEAVFGLGEGVVSGRIQPDNYVVSRELKILKKHIADKKIAITRNSAGQTETIQLTEERSKSQVLSEYEIKRLANYALELEQHYKMPQDIEFAIDSGKIYIVQTRPITTLKKQAKKEIEKTEKEKEEEIEEIFGKLLLEGIPASPGIGSGEVKIIRNLQDLSKIKKGDVLVTKMTNPDMVVTMQKCAAIVTDEGGMTAHAAIVSREMGIPAVVGTKKATSILREGMIITIDGSSGKVYEGKLEQLRAKAVEILPVVETKTKIKVIVDLPDFAERASKTECRDVGLVRIEGIIAENGKHPNYFLKEGKINDYETIIYNGISKIAQYFDELWIRTSDIRSDEFHNLEGAPKTTESNPMLGMHGIRYGLKNPSILEAELNAMKKVANSGKVIGILLPQLISVDELQEVKKMLKEIDFADAKIGVMIETPAAVQIIQQLCEEGIDFISFGTNDLTQFTLAIDRGNEAVQYLYDEMHPAILSQLAFVISICKKYNVETSICGQAGSNKKMVEFLVKNGINSMSVNADAAHEISEFVAELEKQGKRGIETGREKEIGEIEESINLKTQKEKYEEAEQEAEEETIEEEVEKEEEFEEEKMAKKKKQEIEEDKSEEKEVEEKIEEEKEENEEDEEKEEEKQGGEEEKEDGGKEEKKEEWSEEVDLGFDPFANQSQGEKEEGKEEGETEKAEDKEETEESGEKEVEEKSEDSIKEEEGNEDEEDEDKPDENEELDIF